MNVGRVCKAIPAHLPHELLGYEKDDLRGMLLTTKIVNNLQIEENEAMNDTKGQRARLNKFKTRK